MKKPKPVEKVGHQGHSRPGSGYLWLCVDLAGTPGIGAQLAGKQVCSSTSMPVGQREE